MKYFTIRKDILATLAYFEMFDYPLKKKEIFSFLGHCNDYLEFDNALTTLLKDYAIFKLGDLYSLKNDFQQVVRRNNGNERAAKMLKKADRAAAIIAAFPFVKGVAISGSLSKYFADEHSDIDFFVITTANRLWIARTFLHIFKKFTFLIRRQHSFCMNYFIDEEQPVILEKNIYTAVEIATIMPLYGTIVFDQFFEENKWANNFLPNRVLRTSATCKTGDTWYKSLAEKVFNNRFGNMLDDYLMRLTEKSWDLKTRTNKKNSKGFLMSMHVGKHFSKARPEIFQKNILQRYETSLSEIFRQFDFSLAK